MRWIGHILRSDAMQREVTNGKKGKASIGKVERI